MYNLPLTIDWKKKMNEFGANKIPFLFIINFKKDKVVVVKKDEINIEEILFKTNIYSNYKYLSENLKISFNTKPVDFKSYLKIFNQIKNEIYKGNSYLLNLTFKTLINGNINLKQIFYNSNAQYKLYVKDNLVVFSPECFIKINNNKIYTYPMKGTINAEIKNAKQKILNNKKEQYEHATIVDLLRNDLGQISKNIRVNKYRFIQNIKTNNKNLLQISSEICGDLPIDYNNKLGDILDKLLPAGSISGAPKQKTLNLICNLEQENRNFYSGVFGYFDGENLDSGIMIRFIEKNNSDYFYNSGSGITANSIAKKEYQEMLDKIYVPIY